MTDWLVSDGRVVVLAAAVLGLEALFLTGRAFRTGRRDGIGYLATTLSGLFLMLALHAALVSPGAMTLVWLALGFLAHCVDLHARFRR